MLLTIRSSSSTDRMAGKLHETEVPPIRWHGSEILGRVWAQLNLAGREAPKVTSYRVLTPGTTIPRYQYVPVFGANSNHRQQLLRYAHYRRGVPAPCAQVLIKRAKPLDSRISLSPEGAESAFPYQKT